MFQGLLINCIFKIKLISKMLLEQNRLILSNFRSCTLSKAEKNNINNLFYITITITIYLFNLKDLKKKSNTSQIFSLTDLIIIQS